MRIKACEPEGRSESGVFVNRESATIPPAESEERETGRGTAWSAPRGRRIEGDSQPPIEIPDLTAKVKHSKNRSLLFITSDKLLTVKTSNRAAWILTSSSLSLVGLSRMRNHVLISANCFKIRFGFSDWRLAQIKSDCNLPPCCCIEFADLGETTRHRLDFTDKKLNRIVSQFLSESAVHEERIAQRRSTEYGRTGGSISTHRGRCDDLSSHPCPSTGRFLETRQAVRNPGVWTNPVDLLALAARMQLLCELKLPVSIRVPFAGGFHSYTGVLDDASIGCQGIRLTGPTFASGIEGHSLGTASIVSSSSGRSHKTTLEIYGNDGLPIAQFRGSHNVREHAVWQDIMNSLLIEIV